MIFLQTSRWGTSYPCFDAAGEAESFLEKIKPPRLGDAGLEDCALPPESIKEAFLKAASVVRSIISASGDEGESEGRCVEDPWEDSSETLVGITEGVTGPSEGCAAEKGSGLTEAPGDKLAVGGDSKAKVDAVVGPGLPEGGEVELKIRKDWKLVKKVGVFWGGKMTWMMKRSGNDNGLGRVHQNPIS
ncbi:hypothetical protein Pfo_019996 [Paulownia fortunei]|nr:hypothetical protein Pfo_019996 [Paulownia fortunei]